VGRPNYAFLVYQAARLAAQLGQPRVSILEFGVAGGEGLLALEHHAEKRKSCSRSKSIYMGLTLGKDFLRSSITAICHIIGNLGFSR